MLSEEEWDFDDLVLLNLFVFEGYWMLNIVCDSIDKDVFILKLPIKTMLFLSFSGLVGLSRNEEFVPPFDFGYLFNFDIELDWWLKSDVWFTKSIDLVFLLSRL